MPTHTAQTSRQARSFFGLGTAAGRDAAGQLIGVVNSFCTWIVEQQRQYRGRQEMSQLDERMLGDVGLTRQDLERALERSLWAFPSKAGETWRDRH